MIDLGPLVTLASNSVQCVHVEFYRAYFKAALHFYVTKNGMPAHVLMFNKMILLYFVVN